MAYTRDYTEDFSQPGRYVRNGVIQFDDSHLLTLTGSRTGESLPNWRDVIARGENATTDYSLDRTRSDELTGGACSLGISQVFFPEQGVVQTRDFSGHMAYHTGPISHVPTSLVEAEAMALSKIYKTIQSELQRVNLSSTLAEFGDVIRQFGAPFNAIVDLTNKRLNRLHLEARGLKGSVVFKRLKFAEIVASSYLEYAFGLAPLISDTRKAAEGLARWNAEKDSSFLSDVPHLFRTRAISRGLSSASTDTTQSNTIGDFIWGTTRTLVKTECRVQYTVGLSTTPVAAFGSNDRLLQILGFKPENWIPAAWEVVPWSWLVDYFTNVSDILDAAATTISGVTWVSKAVTYVTVSDKRSFLDSARSALSVDSTGVYKLDLISGTGLGHQKFTRTTTSRVRNAQLSVPPLVFTIPTGIGQLANMAAVLARKPQSSALWLF